MLYVEVKSTLLSSFLKIIRQSFSDSKDIFINTPLSVNFLYSYNLIKFKKERWSSVAVQLLNFLGNSNTYTLQIKKAPIKGLFGQHIIMLLVFLLLAVQQVCLHRFSVQHRCLLQCKRSAFCTTLGLLWFVRTART